MKKFFMLVFCLIMAITVNAQNYDIISKDQLPKNTIEFIDKYYSDSIYANAQYFVEYEFEIGPSTLIDEYEVRFDNGTKLEFNRRGNLTSIDCGVNDKVNIDILPEVIKNQIKNYNKNIVDLSIEYNVKGKKPIEYEIDFDNGFERKFNSKGNPIRD